MNIDSSNILSLLSPSSDLENIQQRLNADSSIPQEFSDTLMDKINRLSGALSGANDATAHNLLDISGSDNKLHGFAGLLNKNGTASEISGLFGNGLPRGSKLEHDIDLESTLEALTTVIESLETDVSDRVNLDKKFGSLLDKVEAIKIDLPIDSELPDKLNGVADTLKTIRAFLVAASESQEKSKTNDVSTEMDVLETAKTITNPLPFVANDKAQENIELKSVEGESGFLKQNEPNVSDNIVNKLINISDDNRAKEAGSILHEEGRIDVAIKNNGPFNDDGRSVPTQGASQLTQINLSDEESSASVAIKNNELSKDVDQSIPAQEASQLAQGNASVVKEQLKNVSESKGSAEKESRSSSTLEVDQVEKNNEQQDVTAYLQQQLDKVVDEVGQIKELVSIDNETLSGQIDSLKTDVMVLRENVFQQVVDKSSSQNGHAEFQPEAKADSERSVLMERQISVLASNLVKTKEPDTAAFVPVVDISVETKKEHNPLKQSTAESALSWSSREGMESLLQQENALRKPGQDNPVMAVKQAEKIEILSNQEPEQNLDKTLPRFATDIANLNRAILVDNKHETLPAITKHFAHPEWNKEMSERVIWMHKQAIPSAELRLNPGHLGPITIKIDVTQDQATVAFTAQHAAVKEAIEAALPKLREMFSAQQLNLTSVNVSQEESSQRQPREFLHMGNNAGKEGNRKNNEMAADDQSENILDISEEIEAGRAIASNGLLSVFA